MEHPVAYRDAMKKAVYWGSTGLLTLLLCFSAGMYLFSHEMAAEAFVNLGFPTWVIYPLAIAKLLAVAAILTRRSAVLLEWAYAGVCFDLSLAVGAHLSVGDGEHMAAVVGLVLLFTSYVSGGLRYGNAAFPRAAKGG